MDDEWLAGAARRSAAGGAALRGAATAAQGPYGAQPRRARRPHRVQQVLLAPLSQRHPAPELAVEAWPRPAAESARAAEGEKGEESERYEDDPTLPWWDEPAKERASGMNRLLLAAALLLVLVLLLGLAGAVASG